MSWTERRLDQLGYLSRGRSRHRPRDAAHLYDGPYPFIQTSDVKHAGLYIEDYQQTYSEAGLEQSKLWPVGTLCITIAANIAETAILGIEACFPDSVIGFIPDEKKAEARFIKYLFDAQVQRRFQQFTQGAAQDNLSQEKLLSIKFPVPDDIDEQKSIADVLSAYDDLIENNRRRMVLLEEAARQLYREWFVRLRFPGHEHTRIIDGVPERWGHAKVGSLLAKITSKNKVPKDAYLFEGPIPCVDQSADFIGGFTDDDEAVYSGPLPVVVFGDHTRILKFVNFAFARGADGTQIIYPNTGQISTEYLYFALREINLSNFFYARHFKFLKEKGVLLPEGLLVHQFTQFARVCFEQVQTLRVQNQKLRAARDLLLPRLMSGEIAV